MREFARTVIQNINDDLKTIEKLNALLQENNNSKISELLASLKEEKLKQLEYAEQKNIKIWERYC